MNLFFFFTIILFKNIFSEPKCIESKNHCLKCNLLTNLCAICEKKDILMPDNNGGCIGSKKCIIGQNYCKECNEFGDTCKLCEEGLFPDDNAGCSYSYNCKLSYKGECFECKENYILIGEYNLKICKSLLSEDFKNCQEIDIEKGVCQECEEGYFLSEGDRRCSKTENCLETVFGNCISCNESFYLDKREVLCINKTDTEFLLCKQTLDGQSCDICDDGLYFDENKMCTFSNFCSESLNGNCKKCISGYYLAKNNFCSNIENCNLADKDTGICLLCGENYYLDDKDYKCKSNLEDNDFKYCSKVDNNICTSCRYSHYLGKDNKCSSTKNCEESENGNCILCTNNYYLGKDNFCSDIEHCIYTGYNGKCHECEDGYYFSDRNQKCLEYKFGDKFYGCKYTSSFDSYCVECKDIFYNRFNDSTCLDNTQEGPFYKCMYSDDEGEFCEVCIDGYYLGSEDKKCILIENCKISENENKCLQCDEFYCLDVKRQKCIENQYLESLDMKIYFSCNRTNDEGTACEQCIEGYEVNEEGYCVDVELCIERENGKCIKCNNKIDSDGYIYKYCANDIFGCVETSYNNCVKCNNLEKIYACTECMEGYALNSFGNCIKVQKE